MRPGDHHHLLDSVKTPEDKVMLFTHLLFTEVHTQPFASTEDKNSDHNVFLHVCIF